MSRRERRRNKVEDLPRVDLQVRNLTPSLFAPARRGTVTLSLVARSDFELWTQVILGMAQTMGVTKPEWITGWLLDFLNSQATTLRKMLAAGILQGLGLTLIERPAEDGALVLEAHFDPKYERLIPAEAPQRPGGLWVPGDDNPGRSVVE